VRRPSDASSNGMGFAPLIGAYDLKALAARQKANIEAT
jgi:hypothetical protein